MGLIESKLYKDQIEVQKLNNLNKMLVDKLDLMASKQLQTSKQKDQLKQNFQDYKDMISNTLDSENTICAFMDQNGTNFFDDEFEKEYLTKFLLFLQKSIE